MKKDFKIRHDKIKPIVKEQTRQEIVENCIHNLLVCLNDNPSREGLIETPNRVYRMLEELFEGMKYTNKEIAKMNDKCFTVSSNDLVTELHIPCFSFCEHHLMLMYDLDISIGYLPNGKVVGLSKMARIADMVCKRLQLQEKIGSDIADILQEVLDTKDVIVVISGKHSCMTARGIKKPGSVTKTATLRGKFDTDHELRSEFYSLLK